MRILLLLIAAGQFYSSACAALTVSGIINYNTVWSDSVLVTGDVIVGDSILLEIKPGTVVRFATTNDNPVFGTANAICLVVTLGGYIYAQGAPENRITFTTASTAPDTGRWGSIRLIANQFNSRFRYCDIMYAQSGLYVGNPAEGNDSLEARPQNCRFYKLSSYAVFCNKGVRMQMDNCVISECRYGVFMDRVVGAKISNTYIYNVAAGVVVAGQAADPCTTTIDHVSFYNISAGRDPQGKAWSGHGIYCTGAANVLNLTNSIIKDCSHYGLAKDGWALLAANNCWQGNAAGAIKETTLAGTDIAADPLFVNAGTFDLRLMESSPSMGTAASSTNRGAWQLGEPWPPYQTFTQYYPLDDRDIWIYDNGLKRTARGRATLNKCQYYSIQEISAAGDTQYTYERTDSLAVYRYNGACEETLYVFKPEMGFSWNVSCLTGTSRRHITAIPPAAEVTIEENNPANTFVFKRYVGLFSYNDLQTGNSVQLLQAIVNSKRYIFSVLPIADGNITQPRGPGAFRVGYNSDQRGIEVMVPAPIKNRPAFFAVYDVQGVRRLALPVTNQTRLMVPAGNLPAGVYGAVLSMDGTAYSHKFFIAK